MMRRSGNNKSIQFQSEVASSQQFIASSSQIDWSKVERILVVRLRSIGDTVLSTPSLIALKRFLPEAKVDILLEDWVAPVLEGFREVDRVLTVGKDVRSRLSAARRIRQNKYDAVFNQHGGTTSTFFVRASGARHRIGYSHYRYKFLYNHLLSSSSDFWQKEFTHSAEQQLALLGFAGVPVADKPKSRLYVTDQAKDSLKKKLNAEMQRRGDIPDSFFENYALFHPAAAFETKQWATENFARAAEFLSGKKLGVVAVATRNEREILEKLNESSRAPVAIFDDLALPEITALAAKAKLFVGNDSGIAHIAAAVQTPTVVVFGSSNRHHWRPWTDAPNEIVYEKLPCQPCAGYSCKEFGEPQCIRRVPVENVVEAINKVLSFKNEKHRF